MEGNGVVNWMKLSQTMIGNAREVCETSSRRVANSWSVEYDVMN